MFNLRAVCTLADRLQSALAPRRWVNRASLLVVAALLATTPLPGQQLQVLKNHVPPEVSDHRAALFGAMPLDQRMHASIVLPLRNQAALTSLLARLYNPSSPDYRHFLSVAEFTEQFGPTRADFAAVVAFAQANGLTVGDLPPNRLIVPIEGTAAQMDTAFNIHLNVYQDPNPTANRTFFAPDREPSLNLSVPVAHIAGLDSFSLPHRMSVRPPPAGVIPPNSLQPATVTGSGPSGSYLGSDMRAAYYGGTTLTGNGQAIGLVEFGGYNLSDVNLSFSNAGQTYQVPINNVLLDGASANPVGDDGEQTLDIVQAIGMAPGLAQVRVYIGITTVAGEDSSILNSMASENIAKQISCSWGWRPADPATDDVFFQEMAAQGQSFFTASGDSGAYDAAINPFFYPADDQYVTAVGGTHLTTNGAAGPWVSETVWNSNGDGSGGGISPDGISIPSWQFGLATSANGGSNTLRNVPDVAMEGDFDNYNCDLGVCQAGWAGTSFATPRWAGFMALINQQAVEAGNAPSGGLGFVNPAIYQLAQGTLTSSDFHDITIGNNDTGGQPIWFNAEPGYDLTTGWGSANGQQLINDLAGPQVPGFWLAGSQPTVFVNPGSTVTSTVLVTNAGGFSGSVNLAISSSLPAGVTASFSPNPATGSSVLTLTASSSAPNANQPARITGTSGTLSASSNITVIVHPPSFSLSALPSTVAVNQGASSTSTISVQPQYGFTGAVNLSVAGLPAGVTASFSSPSTSTTSTLTLTVGSAAAPGNTTLVVTGTAGSATATANVVLSVHAPNFSLSTASTLNMGIGSSATTYVYVNGQYGFAGSVNLAVSGLPAGVTASFAPNPTSASSSLTLASTSSATPGQSTVTITGTSGSLTSTTTFTLTLYAPTFSLSSSGSIGVGQGHSASTYIYVTDLYGFSGLVSLAASGLPTGVTASFSPNPTAGTTSVTFTASSSASVGNSVVTITGTSGSITVTTTINLGVFTPTFTLSSASSLSIGQGNLASTYVYVTGQYGFAGSVNLAISGLPSGVTASLSPNPTTGQSALTFTASSSASVGHSMVTITGTSGSLTSSTTLDLGVFTPTFTLSSSNAVNLGQGSSGGIYVYVNDLYGFTGSVNLAVSGLPNGVTASFLPNPTTGQSTLTFTATSTAAIGQSTVTITGTSGSITATTTLALGVFAPTFTLSSSYSLALGQGSSATAYVYVNGQYGFTGSVNLAISGLPSGVTASFSPNPSTGVSTLTLTAASSAAIGQSTLTITGTSGSVTAATTLTLGVFAPTFSLTSSYSLSLGQGTSGNAFVYVYPQYGFTGSVNLSVSGLPSGVTASFSPNPTTGNSTLTFTATSSAPLGQSVITITGTSGSITNTTTINLGVYKPTFTLTGVGAFNVGQGNSAAYTIYITPEYGFTGNVTLSLSGLPAGVTALFTPNPTSGTTTTITLSASSTAQLGQYLVTLTGVSGATSVSTTFGFTISGPSFTLTSYSSPSLGQGGSGTAPIYINPLYGFTGNVTMSASGLPSGVTASFSPNPATGTTVLTLSASSTAAIGQTTIIVTGTSGTQTASTNMIVGVYAPTFTLYSSGIGSVGQGSSGTGYVYVTDQYGFTGSVTMSVSGLPTGATASFSPNPATGYTTLTVTAASTTPMGQYNLIVTGTSGTQTATTSLSFSVYAPTFTVSSGGTVNLTQGASGNSVVYVTNLYGFNGNITLSASNLPAGITASFSAIQPITGESVLTLTASSTAAVGTFSFLITGTSGSITSTTTGSVNVYAPGITLRSNGDISTGQGTTAYNYLYVGSVTPLTQGATFSISGLPSGVTGSFSPNPSTYGTTLTLTIGASVPIGTSTVTVTATLGSQTATTTFQLSIYAPSFYLYTTYSTVSLNQSGTASNYAYASGIYGFSGAVTYTASGLPSGVTAAFSPNPTSSTTTMTLTAAANATPGPATVTVTGTYGSITSSATFTLTVYVPSFTISASPADVLLLPSSSQNSTLTITPQYGFAGLVTYTASGLPAGVTASISPNPTSASSTITLTAASTATAATGTVAIVATSGSLTAATMLPVTVILAPNPTATTLSLTSAGSPATTVNLGALVTATAVVTSGSTPLTLGQVNFCDTTATSCDALHLIGSAQLTNAGTAILQFLPGPGTHSYKAVFTGTHLNATSASAPSPLSVTASLPSTTTIASSGTTGNYTLTATVAGLGPVAPTGKVSFLDTTDGNFPLGTATLGAAGTPTYSFNIAQSPTVGTAPDAVATGDFNGDGIPDLAVANSTSTTLTILLGNGDGTFRTAASFGTGLAPDSIAVADFNRDGRLDIVVASSSSGGIDVYLGNGDGTFTPAAMNPQTGANPSAIAVGDYNGDGLLDLAVTGTSSGITIFFGNGDGTFTASTAPINSGIAPRAIVQGDFNGDGFLDLAYTDLNADTVRILLGVGDGTFTLAGTPIPAVYYPTSIATADLNGDGKLDLVVGSEYGYTLNVLLGKGDGTFTAAASPTTYEANAVAIADVNGDGNADIITANGYGTANMTVLLGNGDGTFATGITSAPTTLAQSLAIGDWNGDGIKDIAVTNSATNNLTVFTSQLAQKATASTTGISPVGQGQRAVDAAYSGDTVYAPSTSPTTQLAASAGAPTVTLTPSPATITVLQALPVTIAVNAGVANPVPTGTVLLTSGTFTSPTVALAAGAATITVPAGALPLGTDSLSATYVPDAAGSSIDTTASGTASVTVTQATPILTWPTPAPIFYGAALTTLQLNATASVPGTFLYTPAAGAFLSAGSQTLQTTFTPTDTLNYTTASTSVTLTVNPPYGIWIANGNSTVSAMTQSGAPITLSALPNGGQGVAIDSSGYIWSLNPSSNSLAEFSKSGAIISSGFTGGGLTSPTSLAIDGGGILWIANANNTISTFTLSGASLSPTPYTAPIPTPTSISIDASGNLWITNSGDNSVTEIIGVASPVLTPISSAVKTGKLGAKP